MKTTNDKQITSYSRLVRVCNSIGARYNPGQDALKPTALSSLLEQAQQSVKAVTVAHQAHASVVSQRAESFEGISKLATRIFNAMASWKASEKTLEDAMQIRQTFRYHPPKGKPDKEGAGAEKRAGNRAVQLNFEAMANNFQKLVECVKTVSNYAPNEQDLKVESLEAFSQKLFSLNEEVVRKYEALASTRLNRDELLFGTDGIHGVAQAVKQYALAAFKRESREFKRLNRIRFFKR
jgi:hypothetical protein